LRRAIDNVGTMVARSGTDCNYRPVGNLTTGVHETQRAVVEETCRVCELVGLPVKMLDQGDLVHMGIPPFVKNAFHELIGGEIHPAKYVYALAKIAAQLGVMFFENTPVTGIQPGDRVRIATSKGQVTADRCVVATNAYSSEIGLMHRYIIPYSVSVMVTERLTDDQRRRINWPNSEPCHTPHKIIENIRLTPDGRLLIGTKRARLGYGTQHPRADDPKPFRALVRVLRDRFPQIPELRPDVGWTGRIAVSSDFMPFFDYLDSRSNIVFGGGYGGHGIAMASYAGNTLARMLLAEDTEDVALFVNRKRPRLPPEPIRWLVGNSLSAIMIAMDNAIDRKVRRQTNS
jgi:gamma-glutamylputrescine oxidase